MDKIVVFIAERMLDAYKGKLDELRIAVEKCRDDLMDILVQDMDEGISAFSQTTDEILVAHPDPDDPDVYYTLAKRTIAYIETCL